MKKKLKKIRPSAVAVKIGLLGYKSVADLSEALGPLVNADAIVQGLVDTCSRFGYPGYAFVFMGTARHAARVSRVSQADKDCLEELSNIFFILEELLKDGAFPHLRIAPQAMASVTDMLSGRGPIDVLAETPPYRLGTQAGAHFASTYGADKLFAALFLANMEMLRPESPLPADYRAISVAIALMLNDLWNDCFKHRPTFSFGGPTPIGSAN